MALKIRLRQQGRTNRRLFRIVVTDGQNKRDGKYNESLGWYNPYESSDEKKLKVDADRAQHWLDRGAQMSEKVESLIASGAPAVFKSFREKQQAARLKGKKAPAKG